MVDSGGRVVELGEYLNILRRRWLGVLIIALTALALRIGRHPSHDEGVHRYGHGPVRCSGLVLSL